MVGLFGPPIPHPALSMAPDPTPSMRHLPAAMVRPPPARGRGCSRMSGTGPWRGTRLALYPDDRNLPFAEPVAPSAWAGPVRGAANSPTGHPTTRPFHCGPASSLETSAERDCGPYILSPGGLPASCRAATSATRNGGPFRIRRSSMARLARTSAQAAFLAAELALLAARSALSVALSAKVSPASDANWLASAPVFWLTSAKAWTVRMARSICFCTKSL
ncbi:hypothetical protein PARU111607_09205 [Palleronia rufa]